MPKEQETNRKNRLFWALNGKLTEQGIRERVRDFKEKDFGGFFLHARAGLKSAYLSEEWFAAIGYAVDEAEKCGLEAWLYDEDGWPSGFAGGRVNGKGEDYCQKSLTARNLPKEFSCEMKNAEIDDKNFLAGFSSGRPGKIPEGSRYACFGNLPYKRDDSGKSEFCFGYKVNPFYVDIFSPRVTDEFIAVTHEEYKRRFGDRFGKTIKGIFTDEPQYGEYCYSPYLEKAFEEKKGYDLLDFIYLLFGDGQAAEVFRQDYYDVVCSVYKENYIDKINEWCVKNNLLFTGHFPEEDGISTQYLKGGNAMLNYTGMDFPGIDYLGRRYASPVLLKQISSAKNQLGKKEIISESFGCCGWGTRASDYLGIWGYESAHGINNACLHLSAYSIAGVRKRDYPAFFSAQNNWWDSIGYLNRAMNGMNEFSSRGESENDALVISPVYGCYSEKAGSEKSANISAEFRNLVESLISAQVQFDIADETYLSHVGAEIKNGKIKVGKGEYELLIVPSTENITKNTEKLISGVVGNGIPIAFCERFPEKVEGEFSEELKKLKDIKRNKKFSVVQNRRDLWVKYFDYIDYRRKAAVFSEREKVLTNNVTLKTTRENKNRYVSVFNNDYASTVKGILAVNGCGQIYSYDALTGKETPLGCYSDEKATYACFSVEPKTLNMFVFKGGEREKSETYALVKRFSLKSGSCALTDANTFTIDRAELIIDGKSLGEDYVLNVQSSAYKESLKATKPFKMLVKYKFFCENKPNDVCLCMENSTCEKVEVNGAGLSFDDGFYVDESIRHANISHIAKQGENEICAYYNVSPKKSDFDLDCVFETEKNRFSYEEEIESVYLTGNFDVVVEGKTGRTPWYVKVADAEFKLKTPAEKNFDAELTSQGLWFYRGDIEKTFIYDYNCDKAELDIEDFDGALCIISINGKEAGCVTSKEKIDLTPRLKKGENLITVRLKGTNRNMFGPHHHYCGEQRFVGVNTFKGTRGYEDEILSVDPPVNTYTPDYAFTDFYLGAVRIFEYKISNNIAGDGERRGK